MNRFTLLVATLSLSATTLAAPNVEMTGTVSQVLSERELVMTDAQGEVRVYKDARIGGDYRVGDQIKVSAKESDDWLKLSEREIIASRIVKLSAMPR
jgi:hypothetical protein